MRASVELTKNRANSDNHLHVNAGDLRARDILGSRLQ